MRGGGKPAGSCLPCNQQARSAPFHDSPCVESPEIPLAPAPPATLPDLTLTSSHTVDSNTESAIARYRCLLVPRASSLSVTLRLGSFTRQVSPYFVLRPAPSPFIRPSFSTSLASSLTQTLSLCRPRSAVSLHPCSIRVLRPTATAGFDPSLAMERDARCARTMDKDGEQTNGSGSRRGCRSFVHGRGKTIVRIPSRSGLRGPVRSRGRGNERTNGRTRPSSQI